MMKLLFVTFFLLAACKLGKSGKAFKFSYFFKIIEFFSSLLQINNSNIINLVSQTIENVWTNDDKRTSYFHLEDNKWIEYLNTDDETCRKFIFILISQLKSKLSKLG